MRAAYNWVSLWLGHWIYFYVILSIVGFFAVAEDATHFFRDDLNVLFWRSRRSVC